MNLVQLAADRFAIFAVCDQSWECSVLKCLLEASDKYPNAYEDMRSMLFDVVPRDGPPSPFGNRGPVKRLKPPFLEFRSTEPLKLIALPVALRVIFFEDKDNDAVICTSAFLKNAVLPRYKTPDWLPNAEQRLAEYRDCNWDDFDYHYLARPEPPWHIR
jgi:hypothetical protein